MTPTKSEHPLPPWPREEHYGIGGQINPPYDLTAPCPMCSNEVRSVWATTHNMLNRWRAGEKLPESKFWHRLRELVGIAAGDLNDISNPRGLNIKQLIATAHPEVRPMLETVDALTRCVRDALAYDKHVQPVELAPAVAPFVAALREQVRPVALLNEAHFEDTRHSQGVENILRSQRGYSDERGGEYDWTVDVLKDPKGNGGDLVHKVCGTHLVLHAHFRERIRRDRAWYGKVWCPACRGNMPWAQFECRVTS